MSRYIVLWEQGENTVMHSALIAEGPSYPPIARPSRRPEAGSPRRLSTHKERAEQLDSDGLRVLATPASGAAWLQAWRETLLSLGCPPATLADTTCALRPAAPLAAVDAHTEGVDITELLNRAAQRPSAAISGPWAASGT